MYSRRAEMVWKEEKEVGDKMPVIKSDHKNSL